MNPSNLSYRKKMLRRMIGEKIFCGLDIGSQRIKAGLLNVVDADHIELLGVYESKTNGFKDSSVTDLGLLSDCIHQTIKGLAEKTGVKLKELYVGVGGDLIEKKINTSVIPLLDRGSKVIGAYDIRKVNNQSRLLGVKVEEEILHDFPQFYKVDDVNTALNPLGLLGRKLEVQTLLIVANVTRIKNITKAVNQAGYDVAKLFFSSYSSSEVALNSRLCEEGSILIDIGSKVTNIIIFKDGQLKYLDKISMGGDHLTQCIAQKLNLPIDLAEDIKKSYAIVISDDPKNEEEILVKRGSSYIPIKRQEIYCAINDQITQLIAKLQGSINKSGFLGEINHGIIMVGGGSFLTGLVERMELEMKCPVKLGKIKVGSKSLSNAPVFSSAVGLAKMGWVQSSGMSVTHNGHHKRVDYFFNKVKELYQEYF